jgi:hypothetical protein
MKLPRADKDLLFADIPYLELALITLANEDELLTYVADCYLKDKKARYPIVSPSDIKEGPILSLTSFLSLVSAPYI